MIMEHALLDIGDDRSVAFEAAMGFAARIAISYGVPCFINSMILCPRSLISESLCD